MSPRQRLDLLLLLLGLAALALPWLAWARLRWLEARNGKRLLVRGVTGDQAARIILLRGEMESLPVDETLEFLGNSYAGHLPAVRLAPSTYFSRRLFSVLQAARVATHALQHREGNRGATRLARLDALAILWGNLWPVILFFMMLSPGRIMSLRVLAVAAITVALSQLLAHLTVRQASQRARAQLDEAHLLDGHPAHEITDALVADRMSHLAQPARQSLWGALRPRDTA